MKKNTIAIRSHIDIRDIEDLLCSASKGAIYWSENNLGFDKGIKEALSEKGTEIKDFENCDQNLEETIEILNRDKIKRGLTVMANKEPKHFADFVRGDYDQITGDVFLQCCLFGEVIYG